MDITSKPSHDLEPLTMTTSTARSIRFHSVGPASVLSFDELPLLDPGENEIRIRVQAIGLNRAEIMFREGK